MTNEKRFVLFVVLVFVWMMAYSYHFAADGLEPAAKKPLRVPPRTSIAGKDKARKA